MRICFLIDSWFPVYGGGPVHVWEVARRLVKQYACQVDIITRSLRTDSGEKGVIQESYFDGKLRIIRLGPLSTFHNVFARLWFLIQSFFYLLFSTYDIINAQAFLPAIPAKAISFFKKTPIVYTVHGTGVGAWDELQGGIVGKFYLKVEKTLLFHFRYHQLVSVSEDFLQFPNVNTGIRVIHNGVNVDDFDRIHTEKNRVFKILFVGRLHAQKGLKYLIRAMRYVIDKYSDIELHIIGTGNEEKHLKTLSKALQLERNVFFRGKIFGESLIREYKSSHLFVLPSLYEGQPLTILQAWAAKLPVIATNVGATPYIIENGVDGYIVESKNPNQLSDAIIKCINSNSSLLGINGYKKVKQNFSWDNAAKDFFNIYSDLIKSHG